jgi:hypothetical protein
MTHERGVMPHDVQVTRLSCHRVRLRMLPRLYALLAVTGLLLPACDLIAPVCTLEAVAGLNVTVEDSLTGAPAASGAQLIAPDGAFADTVSFPPNRPDLDPQPLPSAWERPGTYTVTVRKSGYVDWVRRGVLVTAGKCHVRAVALTARLQRIP